MRIIKKKTLDELSRKLKKAEKFAKEIKEINLDAEERVKLQRFDLYHVIRLEKYTGQGDDPTFGNLDGQECTEEEFEYHLSHVLDDFTPEERYRQQKEMYYFHPSYVEMEKIDYWEDRAKTKYCTGQQCILDCPYYPEIGRIEDDQVIQEFLDITEILEIEDYKKHLGNKLVTSIISNWDTSISHE
ncbi:MAG TPA: hypothetical protein VFG45_03420 [Candidatus Nitrosocosmicus sp.]|nr:hypothetical protein [Candidatus Nitrosocosmicus sp.]